MTRGRRPLHERLALAAIAIAMALLFGGVAVAAALNGEPFLAVMAVLGALMTLWAAGSTLLRG